MKKNLLILTQVVILSFFIAGCAQLNKNPNKQYEEALYNKTCTPSLFKEADKKIKANDDPIFVGLNAGSVARGCKEYKESNALFDAAESAYKTDVDLENGGKKAAKVVASTLTNDTFFDYQGSLYERIMVNVYKGLNFMALNNYANARVEFNRALMRQDKAKEYFAKEIAENKSQLEEAKKDPNYKKNMGENTAKINEAYSHLFKEFDAAKNFTNPYATYLASVFFYMDADYRRAASLMREVAIVYPKSKDIKKINKLMQRQASSVKSRKKTYIFFVYEDGLGVIKNQFKLSLPFWVTKNGKVEPMSASLALPTLKKRAASYANVSINGDKTAMVADFDNIVATEFKIELPGVVMKALASTIIKTTLNAVVANNDPTGGWLSLAASIGGNALTKADTRSWRGLPKLAFTAVVPNKGEFKVSTPKGVVLASGKLESAKNALIIVRSFAKLVPPTVYVIQK